MSHSRNDMEEPSFSLRELRLEAAAQRRFGSETWSVLVFRQGNGNFIDLTQKRVCEGGGVLILVPGANGILRACAEGEVVIDYFQFQPQELIGLLSVDERLLFERANRQRRLAHVLSASSALARKFRTLTERLEPSGTLEHRCQLIQLLGPLLHELRQVIFEEDHPSSSAEDRVVAILAQLPDFELQSLSVDELARRCNCSRRHLSRLVRQRFGSSIISLKTQLRLDRAAALLQSPSAKVIQVAYQCGFSHVGSFSARFKERFGTTPAKWRNQMLSHQNEKKVHATMHSNGNGNGNGNGAGRKPRSWSMSSTLLQR